MKKSFALLVIIVLLPGCSKVVKDVIVSTEIPTTPAVTATKTVEHNKPVTESIELGISGTGAVELDWGKIGSEPLYTSPTKNPVMEPEPSATPSEEHTEWEVPITSQPITEIDQTRQIPIIYPTKTETPTEPVGTPQPSTEPSAEVIKDCPPGCLWNEEYKDCVCG